jgi:cytochrome c
MSGDLKWNKIFGAALATGLVILGVREVSTRMFAQEEPEKMGYQIEVADTPEGGEPTAPAGPPDWGTVLASADLGKGEALFGRCTSCHKLDANGTGPGLSGIVGRGVASHPGFAYSPAMTTHRGSVPTWTYDALDAFLASPGKVVAGTKMSFAGLKKQEDRINLIAWLRTQGSAGYPIPAPDPSRQATAPAAPAAAAPPAEGATPTAPPATK